MPQGHGTGTDPELPQDINTDVAHPARVYDYWLGGKDNFAADREVGDAIAGCQIPQDRGRFGPDVTTFAEERVFKAKLQRQFQGHAFFAEQVPFAEVNFAHRFGQFGS